MVEEVNEPKVEPVQPEQPVPPVQPVQPVQPVIEPAAGGSKGMAITAMILGIASLVFMCFWFISLPLAVAGLILGIIAVNKRSGGMAKAGMIMSIVGLVISIIMLILTIAGVGVLNELDNSSNSIYDYSSDYDDDYDYEDYEDIVDDYEDLVDNYGDYLN